MENQEIDREVVKLFLKDYWTVGNVSTHLTAYSNICQSQTYLLSSSSPYIDPNFTD